MKMMIGAGTVSREIHRHLSGKRPSLPLILTALLFPGGVGGIGGVHAKSIDDMYGRRRDAPRRRTAAGSTRPQSRYLEQILLGRCFERPPGAGDGVNDPADLCPSLVPSFLGAIAGRLDGDIGPDAYSAYLERTQYSLEKNAAAFVWPPTADVVDVLSAAVPDMGSDVHWTLPETTPGGSLLRGLVFCGDDRRWGCPVEFWKGEEKGALSSFWEAAYSDFATKARGRVKVVVLEPAMNAVPALWEDSVLFNLDPSAVTSADVLTSDCDAPGVLGLIKAIERIGIESGCTEIETDMDARCQIANFLEPRMGKHEAQKPQVSDISTAPKTNTPPAPSQPEPDAECACPRSIYAYLFWALLAIGAGGTYSLWKKRRYLAEYRAIPDVGNVGRAGNGAVAADEAAGVVG